MPRQIRIARDLPSALIDPKGRKSSFVPKGFSLSDAILSFISSFVSDQ
jgi:hypothetical protein